MLILDDNRLTRIRRPWVTWGLIAVAILCFLVQLGPIAPEHPVPYRKVTYHDACHLLHAQRVHEVQRLLHPGVHVVGDVRRPVGVAEAHHVGRDHAAVLCDDGHRQAPVGPGAHARPGAVDEQHRRLARLRAAQVVHVGVERARSDAAGDFGVVWCVHSFTITLRSSV